MLDEEVIRRETKNNNEIFVILNTLAITLIPTLLLALDYGFSMGLFVAIGVAGIVNIIFYYNNWPDAPEGILWKYALMLLPYAVYVAIQIISTGTPVVEMINVNSKYYAELIPNDDALLVSGSLDTFQSIIVAFASFAAAACAFSIYFIASSRYVLHRIFTACGSVAFALSILGILFFLFRIFFGWDADFGTKGMSFSVFPSADQWCAFAILWQGALIASATYSFQSFKLLPFLSSTRFLCMSAASVIATSIVLSNYVSCRITGVAPIEATFSLLLQSLGFCLLATGAFKKVSTSRGRTRKPMTPYTFYACASVFFLLCGVCAAMYCTNLEKWVLPDYQKVAADVMLMISQRPLFGWGDASFETVFLFFKGCDLVRFLNTSDVTDIQRLISEIGFVGMDMILLTPLYFIIRWIFNFKIHMASFVLMLALAFVAFLAFVHSPFESHAVSASYLILFVSFVVWDIRKQ